MKSDFIKITGSTQTYKLISKSTLPGHKVQLVVEDSEKTRFVLTRQSGCYKYVPKPLYQFEEDE